MGAASSSSMAAASSSTAASISAPISAAASSVASRYAAANLDDIEEKRRLKQKMDEDLESGKQQAGEVHDSSSRPDPVRHSDDVLEEESTQVNRQDVNHRSPTRPASDGEDESGQGKKQASDYFHRAVDLPRGVTRWRIIFTFVMMLILVSTTGLLFYYVEKGKKSHPGICLQLFNDKVGWCDSTPIIIEVFSTICAVFGIAFFLTLDDIRHMQWVRKRHWAISTFFFIFSLLISIFPFFIIPHTGIGFYSSTAYHFFFWVVETSLAARTNTNLHSTFACINLSVACTLMLNDRNHIRRWIRPSIVLVVSAVLHLISNEIVKAYPNVDPPAPPPSTAAPPSPPPPTVATPVTCGGLERWTHAIRRYALWPCFGMVYIICDLIPPRWLAWIGPCLTSCFHPCGVLWGALTSIVDHP